MMSAPCRSDLSAAIPGRQLQNDVASAAPEPRIALRRSGAFGYGATALVAD
jgi:hypothetical protein